MRFRIGYCGVALVLFVRVTAGAAQEPPPQAAPIQSGAVDFGTIEAQTVTGAPASQGESARPSPSAGNRVAPAAPPPTPALRTEEKRGPPAPRIGLQLAVRIGVTLPLGNYTDSQPASHIAGALARTHADVGYKINPQILLGGYVHNAIGAPGSVLERICDEDEDLFCHATSFGFGIGLQYHFRPAERVNPWVGYGLGISFTGTNSELFGSEFATGALSFDFASLSTGVDYRINQVIGLGLFVELGTAYYFREVETIDGEAESTALKDGALHYDFNSGVRVIFTP